MITDAETNTVYISDLLKEKYPELHADMRAVLSEKNSVV